MSHSERVKTEGERDKRPVCSLRLGDILSSIESVRLYVLGFGGELEVFVRAAQQVICCSIRAVAAEGILDEFTHPVSSNHIHASGHTSGRYVPAKRLRFVQGRAIAERHGAGFPAAAAGAAIELADCMEIVMAGILLPMRRFPTAGN